MTIVENIPGLAMISLDLQVDEEGISDDST
jgi:hypothetical protein